MAVKKGGLGRNLSALLGSSAALTAPLQPSSMLQTLALNQLQPGKYQPRKMMDDESLRELSDSIKCQGILQPLVIRPLPDGDKYEIIAGERRWRAAQLAGLTEVPVFMRDVDDETAMAMALVENLQREDLNPIDQARAMMRLHEEFNLTHQQIADILGKSRASVTNFLRLLGLTPEVLTLVENSDLDMGHAKVLLTLEQEQQIQVARLIVAKNLSVREAEGLASRVKQGKMFNMKKTEHELPVAIHQQVSSLADRLRAKVNLTPGKNGKGKIVIHYNSVSVLEQMLKEMI